MVHLFKEFEVLAEVGSFSEAADLVYLSQGALSKHMAKLEKSLNFKLMERTPKGIVLTPAGRHVLEYVPALVRAQEDMQKVILEERAKVNGTVTIVVPSFSHQYAIPTLLSRFEDANQDVEVVFEEKNFDSEEFVNGSYELAFSYVMDDMGGVDYVPAFPDRIVVAMSKANPLSSMEFVTPNMLKDELFLFNARAQMLNQETLRIFDEIGIKIQRKIYSSINFDSLLELTAYNVGVTLMMKRFVEYAHTPELVAVDLQPEIDRSVLLMWKKGQKLSENAKKLVDFVSENYNNLL